jgi:hypothetical protein
MNNNKSWNSNLGKPVFDCPKFSAWNVDKKDAASLPGACMSIDMKTEAMFESRVYTMANALDVKFLSKQSLKTGEIETLILKQDIAGNKTILGQTKYPDENAYLKSIKEFELLMPISSKVVTTKQEYEQSFKAYEK